LLDAHKRGVQVQVILDKSHLTDKYSGANFLANLGVPTKIDAAHAIAHNKIIIIDGETVITGLFNFTKAAQEKNAENLLITRDQGLAAQYAEHWQAHAPHSQPYVGRGVQWSWTPMVEGSTFEMTRQGYGMTSTWSPFAPLEPW
jgi:phosphatidylserine/phosphatidylglycerophosphate/cardiolipin synthase-like enzyme